jgi:hypothetical protein
MAYKFGLFTKQRKPRKALLQLLATCNIQHDGTLADIVRQTQKYWLRPKGKEIWQVPEKKLKHKKQILRCLVKLGCFKRVMPSKANYDCVVIFGGLFERMIQRFVYAWKLLQRQKIGAKQLVFLVGDRYLEPTLENYAVFQNNMRKYQGSIFDKKVRTVATPLTENDFPHYILSHLKDLGNMKRMQKVIVQTPAGSFGRPQTSHTIAEWLEKYEQKPRKCLFVSSNPYMGYQDAVVRRVIAQKKREMMVETVGPADQEATITACLDAIARWLYEEQI